MADLTRKKAPHFHAAKCSETALKVLGNLRAIRIPKSIELYSSDWQTPCTFEV